MQNIRYINLKRCYQENIKEHNKINAVLNNCLGGDKEALKQYLERLEYFNELILAELKRIEATTSEAA